MPAKGSVAQSAAMVVSGSALLRLLRPEARFRGLLRQALRRGFVGRRTARSFSSPFFGKERRTAWARGQGSPTFRSSSLAEDHDLTVAADPLTQAARSPPFFGAVTVWPYCYVRPSKSRRAVV